MATLWEVIAFSYGTALGRWRRFLFQFGNKMSTLGGVFSPNAAAPIAVTRARAGEMAAAAASRPLPKSAPFAASDLKPPCTLSVIAETPLTTREARSSAFLRLIRLRSACRR